jgi:hypothetical protein
VHLDGSVCSIDSDCPGTPDDGGNGTEVYICLEGRCRLVHNQCRESGIDHSPLFSIDFLNQIKIFSSCEDIPTKVYYTQKTLKL